MLVIDLYPLRDMVRECTNKDHTLAIIDDDALSKIVHFVVLAQSLDIMNDTHSGWLIEHTLEDRYPILDAHSISDLVTDIESFLLDYSHIKEVYLGRRISITQRGRLLFIRPDESYF